MAAAIEVRDLTHVYSAGTPFEHTAIENMSFSVEQGELLAIIGKIPRWVGLSVSGIPAF